MKNKFSNNHTFEDTAEILTLNQLSLVLGVPRKHLVELAKDKEKYYHPFIDDQNGKKRHIDKPTRSLKFLQEKIKDRLLQKYPLCNIVYGAVPGRSTRQNAEQHLRKEVVVRLDLSDCFHNTQAKWVYWCFRKKFRYSSQVAKLLTELCTYKKCIPVGSPLSSVLVNIVYDPLWCEIDNYCNNLKHTCTVWVDDITISGAEAETLIPGIKKLVNDHRLKIGWKKLRIQRNHKETQEVTGIVVNHKLGIPKKKRIQYAKTAMQSKTDNTLSEKALGQANYTSFVNRNQGKQLRKIIDLRNN